MATVHLAKVGCKEPLERLRNLPATVLTVASNGARLPTAAKKMPVDWADFLLFYG
jgi:hypothetical protein